VTVDGCEALVVQVPGTQVSALGILDSKFVKARDPGSGWTNSTVTLAAASDSTNRPIGFHVGSVSATAFTDGANLVEPTGGKVIQTAPSITMVCEWRPDAFQTTMNGTWAGANKGCVIATELEQG
jgi:hypothetical protein